MIELETPRLRLRQWRDADREPFAAMNADPAVMEFFPALQTRATSDAGIDLWQSQFAAQGWSNWAVEVIESGQFIGFVGLTIPRRVLPCSPCVEVGWRLARAHWGRGYATEAARAALRVGFERLGLADIVSFTALANLKSRAVMERIGMANQHRDFEHPGVPEGHPLRMHCLYRITREEWMGGGKEAELLPRAFPGGRVRRLRPADLEAFQAYRAIPELGRYQGWSPKPDAEALAFLAEMGRARVFTPGAWVQLGIADAADVLVGDIGVRLSGDGTSAEIGFTLAPAAQGRGIATAAVREALAVLFATTPAQSAVGITDRRNGPSIRLLERLAFRCRETRVAEFRGEPCREDVYVLSRESWQGR